MIVTYCYPLDGQNVLLDINFKLFKHFKEQSVHAYKQELQLCG